MSDPKVPAARLPDDDLVVDWDDFEAMADRVLTLPPLEHDDD